jgi:hypothetical protein
LEEKQDKTQEEMEALVDVRITYKLVDGGKDGWKYLPILFANDKQRYTKSVEKQTQLLQQDKNPFESQAKQLQQEKTNLELQIKEKDKAFVLLRNDKQPLQHGNSTIQQQITRNDNKIKN